MWVLYFCDYDGVMSRAWLIDLDHFYPTRGLGVPISESFFVSPSECQRFIPTTTLCPW